MAQNRYLSYGYKIENGKTMIELQIFENSEFGKIRTKVDDDGQTLFCGSDVAKALAYTNPPEALRDHCKGITKRSTLTSGGN